MAGAGKKRGEWARRMRAQIARLRSDADADPGPKSPREFLDRAAQEEKQKQREPGEDGDRNER